ncbi:Treslin [Acipenser ruthenus]|uniref:Treslin n=1 Tax=Acipenser ruthenus TaxID=7906 RepID=A0A444U5W8_ACIRT|nr:Treslin [Acipenser ruthenus]
MNPVRDQKQNSSTRASAQGEIQRSAEMPAGGPRTPVRQKMKTMSRSLQMLNVARLNVKAQKSQPDEPQPSERRPVKQGKRRSGDKQGGKAGRNSTHFKSEEELLSHLKESYQKAVTERDSSLVTQVQNSLNLIETFLKSTDNQELEVNCAQFVQENLVKSSKLIRQQYANAQDNEAKVRECQLQVVLRLEMCLQCPSVQTDTDGLEQLVEEANMLRIISLSKDPSYLAKFLEEEILIVYINTVPTILGDMYSSLGTQLPEKLASVLPSDFFSDESMTQESNSPAASQLSAAPSTSSAGGERLENLRTRSAEKKRSGMLTRHRSMSDASQSLRQIEMPKKSTRRESVKSRLSFAVELPCPEPPPPKEVVQVSDNHKLLTKKVMETPLHKQVSNRLLHRQIKGRNSITASEVCIVEESPVKPENETDLRRSPRIKKLSFGRRHSSSFYSSSQPRSRNLERVHSASQLTLNDSKAGMLGIQTIRSPVRLLFGAMRSPSHSEACGSREERRAGMEEQVSEELVCQRRAAARLRSPEEPPKFSTPRTSRTPSQRRSPATPNTPSYQVELEMQASGLHKLKFKRTDSFNAGETGVESSLKVLPQGSTKTKRAGPASPLTRYPKRRDTGYASPSSLCAHGTPGKTTPGKGGVQTYICQSYTPTRHSSTPSPSGIGEAAPWTPSPQRRGRSTPESLINWPRRKKAGGAGVGNKEKWVVGVPLSKEAENLKLLEDPDLEGVCRLQDIQSLDHGDSQDSREAFGLRSRKRGSSEAFSPDEEDGQRRAKKPLLSQLEDSDITGGLCNQWGDSESLQCDNQFFIDKDFVISGMLGIQTIRSPVRLLFGAMRSPSHSEACGSREERRAGMEEQVSEELVCQDPMPNPCDEPCPGNKIRDTWVIFLEVRWQSFQISCPEKPAFGIGNSSQG